MDTKKLRRKQNTTDSGAVLFLIRKGPLGNNVGPWYGGVQNVWGEENVPENALSPKFLDPSKRASGLLCRGFLNRKSRALTPEGGGKRTVRGGGGPKPPFGRAVIRVPPWIVRFSTPLFFPPPHGVLWQCALHGLCILAFDWSEVGCVVVCPLPGQPFKYQLCTYSTNRDPKSLETHPPPPQNLGGVRTSRPKFRERKPKKHCKTSEVWGWGLHPPNLGSERRNTLLKQVILKIHKNLGGESSRPKFGGVGFKVCFGAKKTMVCCPDGFNWGVEFPLMDVAASLASMALQCATMVLHYLVVCQFDKFHGSFFSEPPKRAGKLVPHEKCRLHFRHFLLQSPRPATGVSRALRARSVPGVSVGVFLGPSAPGLRSVQRVSWECPRSVKKVSRTLRGHSRDTFWTLRSPGPEGPQRHLEGHSWDTSGPKGPRDSCSRSGGLQTFWRFLTSFALRENCRKVSKIFLRLFDDFWHLLTWPLSAGPLFAVRWCLAPRLPIRGHFAKALAVMIALKFALAPHCPGMDSCLVPRLKDSTTSKAPSSTSTRQIECKFFVRSFGAHLLIAWWISS